MQIITYYRLQNYSETLICGSTSQVFSSINKFFSRLIFLSSDVFFFAEASRSDRMCFELSEVVVSNLALS